MCRPPAQVLEHFRVAESRFQQSLSIKADFVDGFLCLADLEMQRAKLSQGFHAPLPRCAPFEVGPQAVSGFTLAFRLHSGIWHCCDSKYL